MIVLYSRLNKLPGIYNLVVFSLLLASCVSLVSCASILTGTDQDISVSTPNCKLAKCTLSNSQGRWDIAETPGTATVTKDSVNLIIECRKNDSESAVSSIKSDYEGVAWLNILAGGLIGLFVDMGTGAINAYAEDDVAVDLSCDEV